jgi:hypothetical protein
MPTEIRAGMAKIFTLRLRGYPGLRLMFMKFRHRDGSAKVRYNHLSLFTTTVDRTSNASADHLPEAVICEDACVSVHDHQVSVTLGLHLSVVAVCVVCCVCVCVCVCVCEHVNMRVVACPEVFVFSATHIHTQQAQAYTRTHTRTHTHLLLKTSQSGVQEVPPLRPGPSLVYLVSSTPVVPSVYVRVFVHVYLGQPYTYM